LHSVVLRQARNVRALRLFRRDLRENAIRAHLYWGYKLSRTDELLKVTAVCPTVCNLSCEREDVTLDPNKVTFRACRERAKARSEQERTAR
jgi:hypothetical protein